jgi:N-acetyl-gamma-glutamyl-phosphate reductase
MTSINHTTKIRVGIIGGAGYTGGELIRLLVHHPQVDIAFIHSKSNAGQKVSKVHDDLLGDTNLVFAENMHQEIDVLFLCVGHGDAKKFHIVGFDILLDTKLRAWLMEINANPSFNMFLERDLPNGEVEKTLSELDKYLKTRVASEAIKIVTNVYNPYL